MQLLLRFYNYHQESTTGQFYYITWQRFRFVLSFGTFGGSEKNHLCSLMQPSCVDLDNSRLGALSTDTASELDVLRHDGDALGVDGAKVRVLEQTDQISLAGLLQCHDGRALEAQVGLEVLSDLAHQTLEGQLPDQQLRALLVTTDLTKSHRSWPVTMGLLHATSRRRALSCRLCSELLPRSLSSGRLSSRLLRTCHVFTVASHSTEPFHRERRTKTPKRSTISSSLAVRGAAPPIVSHWLIDGSQNGRSSRSSLIG